MLVNCDTGEVLIEKLLRAETFWRRFLGLLPYKELERSQGLLLTPCKSVHTWFMRFAIDIIYLDESLRVKAVYPEVRPWRMLPYHKRSYQVLEVSVGTLKASRTLPGHYLKEVCE